MDEHKHTHFELHECAGGTVELELHTHQDAVVVSARLTPALSFMISIASVVGAMERLAVRIEELGGFIGHIKAFAKQGESLVHVSITDACEHAVIRGDSSLMVQDGRCVELVVITFALEKQVLEHETLRILTDVLNNDKQRIDSSKEYD